MSIKRYAIIVAGGSGIRMGMEIPKQFIELDGKPILMRTIDVFDGLQSHPNIIVVLPESQILYWKELCLKHNYTVQHRIVNGGKERFFSVQNGLDLVDDSNAVVAIHDGVRPLVSVNVVEECYRVAEEKGNAIPVVQPVESVRLIENESTVAFSRSKVRLVQTPQVFRASLIKKSYSQSYKPEFTDDASVIEAFGEVVYTVEGNVENIKITNRTDLLIATALLQNRGKE